jgi:hypothetical protein
MHTGEGVFRNWWEKFQRRPETIAASADGCIEAVVVYSRLYKYNL